MGKVVSKTVDVDESQLVRWFQALPEIERYRFSSQWMKDEAGGISNAKMADLLVGGRRYSETFVKSFRSYNFAKGRLNSVSRPAEGFSKDDVHQICAGINRYREGLAREDRVSTAMFYQRAWQTLKEKYPLVTAHAVESEPAVVMTAQAESPAIHSADKAVEEDIALPDTEAVEPPRNTRVKSTFIAVALNLTLLVGVSVLVWRFMATEHESAAIEKFLPGNIVQLSRMDEQGHNLTLEVPEHYLDAKTCYPTVEADLTRLGTYEPKQLHWEALKQQFHWTSLVPELPGKAGGILQYHVLWDGTRRWKTGKGLINVGASDTCLASLQNAVDLGIPIENYGVVLESYVAETIRYEVMMDNTAIEKTYANILDIVSRRFPEAEIESRDIKTSDGNLREISVSGPFVVGYVSENLSAIMAE